MLKRLIPFILMIIAIIAFPATADTQFSIVSPEWVAAHVNDFKIRILDVRTDPYEYFRGHVPNAVHIADNTLRGPKDGMPVQYLPPDISAQLFARAGIHNDYKIIIYSEGANVLGATMTAYALERMGHSGVMVIDGGWSVYKTSHPTSQIYPTYKTEQLLSRDNKEVYVTTEEVRNLIGKPGVLFIDARPNKLYTGEVTYWTRNGHIPGAINIDWHVLVNESNPHKFKSIDEIKAVYVAKGVKGTEDIIVYCGTSREATLEYFVLKHMMGYPKVRLYEGSWTEYSSHPDLPVETGNPK